MQVHKPYKTVHDLGLTLLVNSAIALALSLFSDNPFWETMLYSQCVGLSIAVCIECLAWAGGRSPSWQTHRWWLVVPLGVLFGFFAGSTLAHAILGGDFWAVWQLAPEPVLGLLLMSLAVGFFMTHSFIRREQLAVERERVQEALKQSAQAQLHLLQSQLEPHMLFNTLANLRVLIESDVPRAQAMLDHLVRYLRATLEASRAHEHSLAQEFARLDDYLSLIQIRMGSRLKYALELPDEWAGFHVPPLLLQSLVENAIHHGIEPMLKGGSVGVRVMARQPGTLSLEVHDDGRGNPDELNAPECGAGRFGIAQVRERLLTRYGPHARLVYLPRQPQGVRAVISLPVHESVAGATT